MALLARPCLSSNQAQSLTPPPSGKAAANVVRASGNWPDTIRVYGITDFCSTERCCVFSELSQVHRMIVATPPTTRGQEVHLIRGSEWQTGARYAPRATLSPPITHTVRGSCKILWDFQTKGARTRGFPCLAVGPMPLPRSHRSQKPNRSDDL